MKYSDTGVMRNEEDRRGFYQLHQSFYTIYMNNRAMVYNILFRESIQMENSINGCLKQKGKYPPHLFEYRCLPAFRPTKQENFKPG